MSYLPAVSVLASLSLQVKLIRCLVPTNDNPQAA